jgi:hypothetical protein
MLDSVSALKRIPQRSTAGSKGGRATAAGMTAAELKARAKKAAATRWAKRAGKK